MVDASGENACEVLGAWGWPYAHTPNLDALSKDSAQGRMIPSVREYYRFYGLDAEKLAFAKPDAIVMHPGPMNRGVEIDPAIADGARSVITDQVEMGVAVRMAVLDALLPAGDAV